MTRIVVNVQLHERRVAILEGGKLVELLIERSDQRRTVGNIYKGVVEDIVPGLQAAFVNIGLPKKAFLHISDISRFDPFADAETDDEQDFQQPHVEQGHEQIQNVLRRGQEILVQIIREGIGTKGPRCTTQLALAGRYVVLIPGARHVGVSRKIRDRSERARLRSIVKALLPEGFGAIVRTLARGRSAEVLQQDFIQLKKAWDKVVQRAKSLPPGSLVFRDAGMIPALIRDQMSPDVHELVVDSEQEYRRIVDYTRSVAPELAERIKLYRGQKPIFDAFGIEKQIDEMTERVVRLPSGGEIVIDQTEALTAIDVNTGRFTGGGSYEDTVFKVNLEAAEEAARQIRLRDIGGLIVVDFIDMKDASRISRVEQTFRDALRNDRATTWVLPMNQFSVIMMTRKRVQQSVMSQITERCPTCGGVGRVYSPGTVVARIERWLIRNPSHKGKRLVLLVHPAVAEELLFDNAERLKDFERTYGVKLDVFADVALSPNSFCIFDAKTGERLPTMP